MIGPLTFMAAAMAAWVLVRAIERGARQVRLLDVPNQRSMHRQPVPRGGGAAIVIVSLLGLTVASVTGQVLDWTSVGGYVVGALLIAFVSITDDILTLSSRFRLAVHVLAAIAMVGGLASGAHGPMIAGETRLDWVTLGTAIIWTVSLTNAYNFMDGIDGLAATQGIVAGLGWTLLAVLSHQRWIGLLALLVAAGCTGFLIRNWPPASIFMGDVGSAFLGFTFASISLVAIHSSLYFIFAAPLLLWPFIFDATFTMLRRLARGEDIFSAHRSHLYQRLVLAGWRHVAVTSLYGLFALVMFLIAAIFWIVVSPYVGYAVILLVLLLSLGLWTLVVRSERRAARRSYSRALMGR